MIKLFTDGSVHPQSKIGYGAYFILYDRQDMSDAQAIQTKRFEDTSSTKLELQTLLWALEEMPLSQSEVMIYTDCQNILSLEGRRLRFEQTNYHTKSGKRIINHQLYRAFYKLTDVIPCTFIKVRGHKATRNKDGIDRLFTLVDRASRDALREALKSSK
ncbi:MAG: ribonuclease H [Epsilonproteobacteria bacterium]|nr:ribonuclease H [Campylobacterota bacterium]